MQACTTGTICIYSVLTKKILHCTCIFPLVCMALHWSFSAESRCVTDGKAIPVESLDMRCSFISVCVWRKGKMSQQLEKTLNKICLGLNLWQFVHHLLRLTVTVLILQTKGLKLECELINSKLQCHFSSHSLYKPAAPPSSPHTWSLTCLVLKYCLYLAC